MKNFILPDKLYNFLKWLCLIVLPAVAVFIGVVFPVWDIPNADKISTTITALALLIGTCIGVSNSQYKKGEQ